jgi:hypothetical protein
MRYFLLILSVLSFAVAAEADEFNDTVAAIPGEIEEVRLVGSWEMDGRQGGYRVVVARAGDDLSVSRLFVQWLSVADTGMVQLDHHQEIVDIADLGVEVVDYRAESDPEGLSLFIDTQKPDSDSSQTYELFFFGPDDYQFGPASN